VDSSTSRNRLRVGYLSPHDYTNPGTLSGMPYSTYVALMELGVEVVDLSGRPEPRERGFLGDQFQRLPISQPTRARWRKQRRELWQQLLRPVEYRLTLREARRHCRRVQAEVEKADVDILFGVCISTMLFELKTDTPIVYASDTTAEIINTTYPEYQWRSKGYHKACDEIEHSAMQRAQVFVAPSRRTLESAVRHYGVQEHRTRLVELGAHVTPEGMPIDPQPPTRDDLQIILVAANPKRKRLGLCIEVVEEMRRRGWNARLNFVGGYDPLLEQTDVVDWQGRLQLSDTSDRQKHKETLRRSHWMLLPSLGEAFGIAPCEAAHFGRPSVVTDVGGLPNAVLDGETGIVLPVDAPAAAYADALEAWSNDPEKYRAMSERALRRAQEKLTWKAFAGRVIEIFNQVLDGGVHP